MNENIKIQMWILFPLFLRTVGSLLKIFELWLCAKPVKTIQWNPPENWNSCITSISREYEIHLRNVWNEKLLPLLGIKGDDEPCWWKDVCSLDVEGVILRKKDSTLGRAIITVIIKSMANIQSSVGSLNSLSWLSETGSQLNNLHTHCIMKNFPRGAFMIFSQEKNMLLFTAACSREIYLTSDIEAFHPYTQFKFCFWNMIHGPHFWEAISNCSLESPPLSLKEIFLKSSSTGDVQMAAGTGSGRKHKNKGSEKYLELEILRPLTSLSEIRTAISLDSYFHNSLTCQISWMSPETTVRLLWNMPLCLNWLEILLLRIYEFESNFLPFVHIPLRLSVKKLAEELYVNYCKTARFLVKAAIIVAEYVYMNEADHMGKCYDARLALKFAISSLVPKLEFLSGPCYQILEVIIKENSVEDKVKQDSAFCNIRVFPDLGCACTIPDMDHIFSSDRRSLNYWIKTKKTPALEESLRFANECVKALQEYEKHLMNQHCCDKNKCNNKTSKYLYVYDKKTYLDTCVEYFNLKHSCSYQQETSFVMQVFDLLKEDQLIEEPGIIKDLCAKLIYTAITCNGTKDTSKQDDEEEMKLVLELAHLGRVYLTCSTFCGYISPEETAAIPDQILLTKLINAECRSVMADVASRFIVICHQLHQFESKPSPSKRVFNEASKAIALHNQKQFSLSEAIDLMSKVQKCFTVDTTTIISLKVSCPKCNASESEDKISVNIQDYHTYLDELCTLRYSLLYEVYDKQLSNTQISSQTTKIYSNVLFPYLHVLEYRLVEEMAALRKCLVMGDKYKATVNRLAVLLCHRLDWIIEKYKCWTKAVVSPVQKKVDSTPNLVQVAVSTRVQIAALLISLQSICTVYLSSYNTLHPMSQSNMDILIEWQSFSTKFLSGPKTFMFDKMKEYYEALKVMGVEYITDLLEHCISAWAVPQLCSNPTQDVELLSLQHAEKIYSALLHFSLLCSYDLLSSNISNGMEFTRNISNKLVRAEVLLRSASVDSSVAWSDTYDEVRLLFEDIICTLHLTEDLNFNYVEMPSWKGYSDIYTVLFKSFISLEQDDLKCLHMDEFLKDSFEWDSEKDEEVSKTTSEGNCKSESERRHYHHKVKKLTKIVCTKHNSKTLVIKKTVIKTVKHSKNCRFACKSGEEIDGNAKGDKLETTSAERKRLKRKAKKERYMLNKKTKDKNKVEKTVDVKDKPLEFYEEKQNTNAEINKDNTNVNNEKRKVSTLPTGEKIVRKKKKSKLPCLGNKREISSKEQMVIRREIKNDKEHSKSKLEQNKVDKLRESKIIDNKIESSLKECMDIVGKIMKGDENEVKAQAHIKDLSNEVNISKLLKEFEIIKANLFNSEKEQGNTIPENVKKQEVKLKSLIAGIEGIISKSEIDRFTSGKMMLELVNTLKTLLKSCSELLCDELTEILPDELKNQDKTEENNTKSSDTTHDSTASNNEKSNIVKNESKNDLSERKDGEKNPHLHNLKKCFHCGITEPVRHLFKKCSLCDKDKWTVKRFYCSSDCQAKDWKARHCQEHNIGVVQ